MKFTEITFHKLFATGAYENERYEIKVLLEEGDTAREAFKAAKKEAVESFKENNRQLQFDSSIMSPPQTANMNGVPMFQPQPIQSIDYKAKEKLEIDIDNAKDENELVTYWPDVVKCGLEQQYKDKYYSFQPIRTD